MKNNLSVIKIGGSLLDFEKFPKLAQDLARVIKKNPALLVHGGGKEVTALCSRLQLETKFVNGRRFTDEATMEVVEMVLSGKVNPYVTAELCQAGVPALGLSGRNANLVIARRIAELGCVGDPKKVRADLIKKFLAQNLCPVFSSIADDGKGHALNINADEMASALAIALRAQRLILFTDVPGILDQNKITVPSITPAQGLRLIQSGVITGGMIPKIKSAIAALKQGIGEIWILHGSLPLHKTKGTVLSSTPEKVKFPF